MKLTTYQTTKHISLTMKVVKNAQQHHQHIMRAAAEELLFKLATENAFTYTTQEDFPTDVFRIRITVADPDLSLRNLAPDPHSVSDGLMKRLWTLIKSFHNKRNTPHFCSHCGESQRNPYRDIDLTTVYTFEEALVQALETQRQSEVPKPALEIHEGGWTTD